MKENKTGEQASLLMSSIVDSAARYKGDIVRAPTMWEFNLSGLEKVDLTEKGRFRFTESIEFFEYDIERLLVGLIAADFVDRKSELVRVYYPHEWGRVKFQEQITKKSVFTMTLDDAVFLLNRCAEVLEIPKEVLKPAIEGYSKYTYLGEEAMKLHQNDIAPALAKKL